MKNSSLPNYGEIGGKLGENLMIIGRTLLELVGGKIWPILK